MRTATRTNGKHKHLTTAAKILAARRLLGRRVTPSWKVLKSTVTTKPYKTIGVAALVSGIVLGALYTKFKL